MYKLIEFLRRIYVAVLFVVFEAIAIGYYAHSSNYTQAKLLTRSNQVVGGVNGIFADIRSYFTLGRENERLLERVRRTRGGVGFLPEVGGRFGAYGPAARYGREALRADRRPGDFQFDQQEP